MRVVNVRKLGVMKRRNPVHLCGRRRLFWCLVTDLSLYILHSQLQRCYLVSVIMFNNRHGWFLFFILIYFKGKHNKSTSRLYVGLFKPRMQISFFRCRRVLTWCLLNADWYWPVSWNGEQCVIWKYVTWIDMCPRWHSIMSNIGWYWHVSQTGEEWRLCVRKKQQINIWSAWTTRKTVSIETFHYPLYLKLLTEEAVMPIRQRYWYQHGLVIASGPNL